MEEFGNVHYPDWEIAKTIGSGSFGTVYEIHKTDFGMTEKAALKVIRIPQNSSDIDELYAEGFDDESITETFSNHLKSIVREYSLMRKMSGSANVVSCDDVRYVPHEDGFGWDIYIKMELLTPLPKVLPADIPEDMVIDLAEGIGNALVLCKKYDIIHRDIKPQNIFVSDSGKYKLGDFGIAKTVEKTTGGTKIGTYKYMAPEVYNNKPYGAAADIYSLGLVLYWMLNERRMPFLPLPPEKIRPGMEDEARNRRFAGEVPPPPKHGSDELKAIVLKACAPSLDDRYRTAEEFVADVRALRDNTFVPLIIPDLTAGDKKPEEDEKQDAAVVIPVVTSGEDKVKKAYKDNKEKNENPEKQKNKKLLPIIIAAACLLLVVGLAVGFGGKNGKMSDDITDATVSDAGSSDASADMTEDKPPIQAEWTEWQEELPEYVTEDDYIIESTVMYSTRQRETTSSTESSTMDGWTLYDTVEGNGSWGPWSDYTDSEIAATDKRQVETQTRYRYRDREECETYSAALDGWTHFNTTYVWSDYGAWSSWEVTAPYAAEGREMQEKTQCRYRSITYTQEYSEWGAWSSWTDGSATGNDLKQVESRTVWPYYYYLCPNCGTHMHVWSTCFTWGGGCGKAMTSSAWRNVWSTTSWSNAGLKDWHGTGRTYTTLNGERVFKWSSQSSKAQYRTRTRSLVDVANYGEWSAWGDELFSTTSTRDTERRTVYRYRDREQLALYHFWRWGDWSDFATSAVTETSTRDVETAVFYRYRELIEETTYYFERWTEWSEYSETAAEETESQQVDVITVYRYKSK